jgi:uncharacterized membrane protein
MSSPLPAVLITLLSGKKEDLDQVRRKIGYRRLILISQDATRQLAQAVQEQEGPPIVRIEPLHGTDTLTHVQTLRRIITQEEQDPHTKRIVLNAAGGDPPLLLAMLLVAYEAGHETWFIQEGHAERLPVITGMKFQRRLRDDEETVLRAVPPGGITSKHLDQQTGLPQARIENALRGLAKKDLVDLYAHDAQLAARPTPTGTYLQDHLKNQTPRQN